MPIVDCAGLFPEGNGYVMEVTQIPEEISRGGYVFWKFVFTTKNDGEELTYVESCPIWLCGPMFKALQFPEKSLGRYDVEPALALGRRITCDIAHEDVKGVPRARM